MSTAWSTPANGLRGGVVGERIAGEGDVAQEVIERLRRRARSPPSPCSGRRSGSACSPGRCARSDFLLPTCASTWLVVPMLIAPCVPLKRRRADRHRLRVVDAGEHRRRTTGRPSSAATSARNVPARAFSGTEVGQLARVDARQVDQARRRTRVRSGRGCRSAAAGKPYRCSRCTSPVSLAMMKSIGSRYL